MPLNWHVDGVKVYKNQKCWVYSVSSAVCKGPVLQSKLVFCVVRESTNAKPKTNDRIGEVIGWICKCLQSGKYPDKDFDGKEWPSGSLASASAGSPILPDGWLCCFSGFKADLEARVAIHKFHQNFMSNQICEHCPAGKKICHYSDFRREASYMSCQLTHQQYLLMTPERKWSSWLHVPGWRKDRNLED